MDSHPNGECKSFTFVEFCSKDPEKNYTIGISGNEFIEDCYTKLHWMGNCDFSVIEICNDCGKVSGWNKIKAKEDVAKLKQEDQNKYETQSEGESELSETG
jgi:epoxyqueuosine reductase QueG